MSSSKPKKVEKSKVFSLSYLVLAVMLLLSIGVTYSFYKSAKSKDLIRFTNQANRFHSSIESRINLYIALLKGARGFVETSKELNNENFSKYVRSLDLENNYAGVQGIGFSQTIDSDESKTLETKMKLEGFSDFKVYPETQNPQRQAIIYLEPLTDRNKRAIGFDMSSEKHRRDAMNRARDTGNPAASGKVKLIQENEQDMQDGFLIYLSIYKEGNFPESILKRTTDLKGFIYSPFRARNFLNEVYKNIRDKDLAIKIYDNDVRAENLLAQTEHFEVGAYGNFADEIYVAQDEIEVAGRKWILEYTSLPSFSEQSNVVWTPLILFCGISFSFMLFGLTYWEAISRAKLQTYATNLFEIQKEKEVLFENESKARLTAEQANLAKDEFIAIVSHELKTPLNAIAGWARILKSDDISNQTRELALSKIDKSLRSQANLVEQLLNYSEIISKNTNLQEENIDFSQLFEEVFIECTEFAKNKEITFVKENSSDHRLILGDREKIRIVIQNLLSNAVKFTPNGGLIETKIIDENGSVKMTIRDNGRGISSEFLPVIFESYKQADNPNTRDYGGLGLGLAISKHIVKLHQGTIEAISEGKGKGSQFIVKLPINNGLAS